MALLTTENQERLVKVLLDEGLADADKLKETSDKAAKESKPLLPLLVSDGVTNSETLTHISSYISGVPYVNLTDTLIEPSILDLLPFDVASRTMSVPLAEVQNRLAVAMLDATNVQAVDYLTSLVQRPVKVFMASQESIDHVLEQYKTDLSSVDEAAQATTADYALQEAKEVKTIVQDSPISKALTTILEYAVRSKASDIHVEPLERSLKIRARIDGVLREVMDLPKSIEPALISRIKIMSSLKIDEHRIPQDGGFTVRVGEKEVDLRIAVSPVIWGEQVVIRLLDKSGSSFSLEEMGYAGHA
jgi:type IV pilus assembly protein PilB